MLATWGTSESNPVRGLALGELGKLLSVDEPFPANTHTRRKPIDISLFNY